MNIEELSTSFQNVERKINLPEYLKKICSAIINKNISKKIIEEILLGEKVNYSVAKVGFLHLIFEYIKDALADNVLTDVEKGNIKFLKLLFNIQAGDFYLHNKADVEATIVLQLHRIYEDNFINEEESLLKVDLQEIFDLSFDQMNDYSKTEAAISIQNGFEAKNLDIFFTQKEFFKLNKQ